MDLVKLWELWTEGCESFHKKEKSRLEKDEDMGDDEEAIYEENWTPSWTSLWPNPRRSQQ